jgi:hypothetical protein
MDDKIVARNKPRPPRRTMRWSPIETAPKDGTQVLCFTKYGDYEISHWQPVTHCWISKRGFLVEATHWSPLPLPPAKEPA